MQGANSAGNLARTDRPRDAQVIDSMNKAQTTLGRLSDLATQLEQRFSPALRPTQAQPGAEKTPATIREAKAPIAESIDVMNDTLVRFEHRLMELIQRSEI